MRIVDRNIYRTPANFKGFVSSLELFNSFNKCVERVQKTSYSRYSNAFLASMYEISQRFFCFIPK